MAAVSNSKPDLNPVQELESILRQPYRDVCNVCKGAGKITALSNCPKCKGSGQRLLKLL